MPRLLLATLLASALCSAGDVPDPAAGGDAHETAIVVAGEPYTGFLLPPATDTEFRFKLAATGDVLTFRWETLGPNERRRIRKLFGMPADESGPVWGGKVNGVRLRLVGGKTLEGWEWPDRAVPGHRCLKTAQQVMQIPAREIKAEEKIELAESAVWTAEEVYQRLLVEKPPGANNAADHLDYARKCAGMGLYARALDHLALAQTIDPRVEERTAEFRQEVATKLSDKEGQRLYQQIVTEIGRGDNASALAHIDQFVRGFPAHEFRTKVDGLRAGIEQKKERDLKKLVVSLYYRLCDDLIQERLAKKTPLDAKDRAVPAIPGKMVVLRGGRIVRGEPLEETPETLKLKQGDATLEIATKEILAVHDVDLAQVFRVVDPTYDELKVYVTDPAAGLGKDIVARISSLLKVSEQKVREAWDGRFTQVQKYVDGVIEKSPVYATAHEATFGKGSWLRDGVQLPPVPNAASATSGQRARTAGTGAGPNAAAGTVTAAAPEENPELSDDPQVWWRGQTPETRFQILRALAAEKLFRVKQSSGKNCPSCGGKGYIEVWDALGTPSQQRCSNCKGLKLLTVVQYE